MAAGKSGTHRRNREWISASVFAIGSIWRGHFLYNVHLKRNASLSSDRRDGERRRMMVYYQKINLDGSNCWRMETEQISVWLSADFGPRVLGLSVPGEENLLASTPEARIPTGDGREYSLRGGHRLWYAPERPETSYIPDDFPPRVREVEGGLEFIQEVDLPTGIQKSWQIKIIPGTAKVEIDHSLTNVGEEAFSLAAWAVTMLRPGGVGLLPFQVEQDDEHGLWPNRQLLVWPYTDIRSEHLQIFNQGLLVSAGMRAGALKVGAPNPLGFLAYRHGEQLFIKESHYRKGELYPDRGASHQIYCNPSVIELETLGPLIKLGPGEAVRHQEIWQVYLKGRWPEQIKAFFDLAEF